jgi:hypothetical protein
VERIVWFWIKIIKGNFCKKCKSGWFSTQSKIYRVTHESNLPMIGLIEIRTSVILAIAEYKCGPRYRSSGKPQFFSNCKTKILRTCVGNIFWRTFIKSVNLDDKRIDEWLKTPGTDNWELHFLLATYGIWGKYWFSVEKNEIFLLLTFTF